MPNTDPRYEQFYKEFKAGLVGAESGGDYGAVNQLAVKKYGKGSNLIALGKYQMVPKYQWSDIQKIAKDNGRPVPQSHEDYLNDQALQELHFDWYTKNKIWPTVKKDSTLAAKKGLSMGEYGYYNHFEPSAAKKYIATGKHREATKLNPLGEKVINNFRKFRDKNGVQPFYGYSDDDLRGEYFHYNARIKKIDENENYSEEVKATLKQELYDKYRDEGYITPNNPDGTPTGFNRIIDEINRGKEEEIETNKESIKLLEEVIKNGDIRWDVENKDGKEYQKIKNKFLDNIYYPTDSKNNSFATTKGKDFNEKLNLLKKKYPDIFEKVSKEKESGGRSGYGINTVKAIKALENEYNSFTKDPNEKITLLDENGFRGKDLALDINRVNTPIVFGKNVSGNISSSLDYDKLDYSIERFKTNYIDYIPPAVTETTNEEVTEETKPLDTTNATTRELSSPSQREEQKTEETLASDDFFRTDMEVPEGIDSQDFKNNFPFAEVLGNAAGAVIGLGMADKKIPMRDEMVSGAFLNYAAELKKLSEIGLRPEEEAYAKRMLTESYSGSIDQIVKASGGNRNLVLGNLGRVDAQKNMSLIQLAVADASAKTDALHKYGEATKYINEFDARRDIANNERKYKDVLMTKEAGAQLAQASFAGIIDSIQNYQDNKPGSANHLYRSHMYRKLLGYDPQLKDDGSGNQKWTFSWMKKNNEKLVENAKEHNEIAKTYRGMTHEERKMMNKFMVENNFKDYGKFADEVIAQRGKGSKFSPEGMDEFKRTGNTSSLFLGQDEVYLDPNTMFADEKVNAESGKIANFGVQQYGKDELANDNIKTQELLNEEKQDNTNEIVSPIAGGYQPIEKTSMIKTPGINPDGTMLEKYPASNAYEEAKNSFLKKGGNMNDFLSQEEFEEIYKQQF